jgi:hypothetical protein
MDDKPERQDERDDDHERDRGSAESQLASHRSGVPCMSYPPGRGDRPLTELSCQQPFSALCVARQLLIVLPERTPSKVWRWSHPGTCAIVKRTARS